MTKEILDSPGRFSKKSASPMPETSTPPGNLPKPRRRRSRWLTFGIPLLLLGAAIGLIIAYDDPPPEDSDMEPKWAQQAANSNPLARFCVDIVSATPAAVPLTPDKPGQDSEIALWQDEVAQWPSALLLMDKLASSDPANWQWPDPHLMHTVTGVEFYLHVTEDHAFVMEAKARLLSHHGKTKEAVDTCLQLVRIGQGMLNTQGDMEHQRVGMGLVSRGLSVLEGVLSHSTTSPEILRHCIAELERHSAPSPENLAFAIKLEYQRLKHQIDEGNRLAAIGEPDSEKLGDKLKASLAFKPNRTRGSILAVDRNILQCLSKGHLEGYLQSLIEYSQLRTSIRQQGIVRVILGANWGGLEATDGSISEIRSHLRWAMNHDCDLRQARIILALRLYELEKGTLPATLDELVPTYLPAVPLDPFSKQPMRWNASTSIIYSIGPDLNDDHGHIQTSGPPLHKDDSMPYWWRKPAKKVKASAP